MFPSDKTTVKTYCKFWTNTLESLKKIQSASHENIHRVFWSRSSVFIKVLFVTKFSNISYVEKNTHFASMLLKISVDTQTLQINSSRSEVKYSWNTL